MVFKGYPEKDVHGLRADAEIPRAYYICPHCEAGVFPLDRRLRLRRGPWSEGVIREAAWLGTTQPSFEMAAETFSRLIGVWISDTTVWRHHRQATAGSNGRCVRRKRRFTARCLRGRKARRISRSAPCQCVDRRDDGPDPREGGREVKMVSVSEVTVRPKKSNAQG